MQSDPAPKSEGQRFTGRCGQSVLWAEDEGVATVGERGASCAHQLAGCVQFASRSCARADRGARGARCGSHRRRRGLMEADRSGTTPVPQRAWQEKSSADGSDSARARLHVALRRWQIRPVWHGKSLPAFILVVSAAFTSLKDVVSDWAVIGDWFLTGHRDWARIGLWINVIGGGLAGDSVLGTLKRAGAAKKSECLSGTTGWAVRAAAVLVGATGLAPSMVIVYLICAGVPMGVDVDTLLLRTKLIELFLETIPQSILQTYVGVSYGRFNPASPDFSLILVVSVGISFLGMGSTLFSWEMTVRKSRKGDQLVSIDNEARSHQEAISVGSPYGLVSVLLRSCQTAVVILGAALVGCANKFPGATYGVATNVENAHTNGTDRVFVPTEEITEIIWKAGTMPLYLLYTLPLLYLASGLVEAVKYEYRQLGAFRRIFLNGGQLALAATAPLWLAGGDYRVANNYNDSSQPETLDTHAPQYFDCRDRTEGTVPFDIALVASVGLVLACCALDPYCGLAKFRPNRTRELQGEVLQLRDKFPTEPNDIDVQVDELCAFFRKKGGIDIERQSPMNTERHGDAEAADAEALEGQEERHACTNHDILLNLATTVTPVPFADVVIEAGNDVEYTSAEGATVLGRVEVVCTWGLCIDNRKPRKQQTFRGQQVGSRHEPDPISRLLKFPSADQSKFKVARMLIYTLLVFIVLFFAWGMIDVAISALIRGDLDEFGTWSGVTLFWFATIFGLFGFSDAHFGYALVCFDEDPETWYMCPLAYLRVVDDSGSHETMKRSHLGSKALREVPVLSNGAIVRSVQDGSVIWSERDARIGRIVSTPQRIFWFKKLLVDSGMATVQWETNGYVESVDPYTLEVIDQRASLERFLELLGENQLLSDMEALVPHEFESTCDASGVTVCFGDWYHSLGWDVDEIDLCEAEYQKLSHEQQQCYHKIEAPDDLAGDIHMYSKPANEESLAALGSALKNSNQGLITQCWRASVGEEQFDTSVVLTAEIEAIWRWADVVNGGEANSIHEAELNRLKTALGVRKWRLETDVAKHEFLYVCTSDRLRTRRWFERLDLHLVESSESIFYYILLGC